MTLHRWMSKANEIAENIKEERIKNAAIKTLASSVRQALLHHWWKIRITSPSNKSIKNNKIDFPISRQQNATFDSLDSDRATPELSPGKSTLDTDRSERTLSLSPEK